MSTHKWIDRICVAAMAVALVLTILFVNGEALGIEAAERVIGYENLLFDDTKVHTIDIIIDDWDGFLETCTNELYTPCAVVIDGEAFKDVGVRAKGNSSLSGVAQLGGVRYSLKIEFDQYDNSKSYHGLDKLELNNLIYDNTMMKDYLVYQMMDEFGVAAPLCSYAYITVNGVDHGLYLAVESVEDSFLRRNYGNDHGELYKPRSFNADLGQMAAGVAPDMEGNNGRTDGMNGRRGGMGGFGTFDLDTIRQTLETQGIDTSILDSLDGGIFSMETLMRLGEQLTEEESQALMQAIMGNMMGGGAGNGVGDMMGGYGGMMASDDVKLKYIDGDPDSYSSIFQNAKTDITKADQNRVIKALETVSNGGNIEDAVDVEQLMRYFVVNNFAVNGDSYTGTIVNNYYLYEKDGRLTLLPWDYNMAFGGFNGGAADSAVNEDIDDPVAAGVEDRPMLSWIFDSDEFTEMYHGYFSEFLETVDISGIIEKAEKLIAPYVERDPTKFCTTEEFETGVDAHQEFCRLRSESAARQLAGDDTPVDTSGLDLRDMGSQGGGMGMMGGFGDRNMDDMNGMGIPGGNGAELPEGMEIPEGFAFPEGMEIPEGFAFPEGTQIPEGMTRPDGVELPEGFKRPEVSESRDGMKPGSDSGFSENERQQDINIV